MIYIFFSFSLQILCPSFLSRSLSLSLNLLPELSFSFAPFPSPSASISGHLEFRNHHEQPCLSQILSLSSLSLFDISIIGPLSQSQGQHRRRHTAGTNLFPFLLFSQCSRSILASRSWTVVAICDDSFLVSFELRSAITISFIFFISIC